MRRFVLLASFLAAAAFSRAAVVERVSLTGEIGTAAAPSFNSMSGSVSASFVPALTATSLTPSLTPAPALLPGGHVPVPVKAEIVVAPAPAPALPLASVPAAPERGPPLTREERASRTIDETARTWSVPTAKIFEDHDALVVGENHGSLASVRELTKALPSLAKSGVGVLGIEGLKRPSQDAVDAWLSGRAAELPAEVLAFSPKRRAAFEALFAKAKEHGVRVVALGLPLDQWSRQAAELAAQKTGDPVESFLRAPGEQLYRAQTGYEHGYNEAVAEVYLTRRNKSMAGFLAEAAARGVKAVALVGQNHVDGPDALPFKLLDPKTKWGTLGRELASLGLKAFSLTLTGGEYLDVDAAKDDRSVRVASHAQAAQASPDGKAVYVPTSEGTGLYHAGGRIPEALPSSRARH